MYALRRILIAWLFLAVATGNAFASWTSVVSDNFTRANTSPGGAGSTTGAGNGWIDNLGGIWQISSNTLLGTTSNPTGYINETLLRPVGEAAIGQRITANVTGIPTAAFALGLRVQISGDFYFAQFGPTGVLIYKLVSGTASLLVSSTTFTLTSGHNYLCDFYVSGSSPTLLVATMTDVTTSTVVMTANVSDSSVTLQGAGTYLLNLWSISGTDTVNFTQATTYTGTPPVSASMTVSPTSVTSGQTGVVLTLTGSGTSFSGSPFSIAGGVGPLVTAQSVSSTTSGTVTINTGAPVGPSGASGITVTDTGSGATAAVAVNPPSLGALKVGWIGDSITAGTNGAPVTQAVSYLTAIGYTVTSVNEGVSGSSTGDWVNGTGGASLSGAISAFTSAGVTIVHVMLGTNDVRSPNNFSAATHHANMITIVNALVAAGFQVVISKPPFTVPNAEPGTSLWPNDPNSVYQQYWVLDVQLMNGLSVFQGDSGAYQISSLSPTTFLAADGVHPADSTENNILGNYWGVAIAQRFGNALVQPWIHY